MNDHTILHRMVLIDIQMDYSYFLKLATPYEKSRPVFVTKLAIVFRAVTLCCLCTALAAPFRSISARIRSLRPSYSIFRPADAELICCRLLPFERHGWRYAPERTARRLCRSFVCHAEPREKACFLDAFLPAWLQNKPCLTGRGGRGGRRLRL